MNKIHAAVSEVQALMVRLSAPERMAPEEAKEFFQEVAEHAEIMIEAVGEDLKALGRR